MKNIFIGFKLLFVTLFFAACGGGDTGGGTSSSGKIEVQTKQSMLDSEQKKFRLEFSMQNNYADGVIAQLSNLSLDLNACSIKESQFNLLDNSLEFSTPLERKNIIFTAEFGSPCLPTGYQIHANNFLTYEGTESTKSYQSEFQPITIDDSNFTIEDTQSIFEYDVKLESVDDESKIALDTKKRYRLSLVNTNSGDSVQADRIHMMRIRSSDPSQVKLIDPTNYNQDQGQAHNELQFDNRNEIVFYIQTYNTSGIADFDVSISYSNNRGEVYDIERRTSVVILSGEPTAFSINDAGVEYSSETKWFTQRFLVSASDKYNNIINIPSKINIAAMADFKDDNGKGKKVLHGKFSAINGNLLADGENHTASFQANADVFEKINPSRDYLLLFGNVLTSEALGKWDIDPYNNSNSLLNLTTAYNGSSYEDLGFAIGHNYMNEICSSESKEWQLQIDSDDGTYQLDENGQTMVRLKFPAYMVGKKIALSVNFSGQERRAGEVHFQTLYSFNGVIPPENISIDVNTTTPTSFFHSFEIDTGTSDHWWVRNAPVTCEIKAENVQFTQFSENQEIKNLADCQGNEDAEHAYWQFTLELIDLKKAGSVSFERCQVNSFIDEF
jgi:hypothetical protein